MPKWCILPYDWLVSFRSWRLGAILSRQCQWFEVSCPEQGYDILRRSGGVPEKRRIPGSYQHNPWTNIHRGASEAGTPEFRWSLDCISILLSSYCCFGIDKGWNGCCFLAYLRRPLRILALWEYLSIPSSNCGYSLQTYHKMELVSGWGLGEQEAVTVAPVCMISGSGLTRTIAHMGSSMVSPLLCLGNLTSEYHPQIEHFWVSLLVFTRSEANSNRFMSNAHVCIHL